MLNIHEEPKGVERYLRVQSGLKPKKPVEFTKEEIVDWLLSKYFRFLEGETATSDTAEAGTINIRTPFLWPFRENYHQKNIHVSVTLQSGRISLSDDGVSFDLQPLKAEYNVKEIVKLAEGHGLQLMTAGPGSMVLVGHTTISEFPQDFHNFVTVMQLVAAPIYPLQNIDL